MVFKKSKKRAEFVSVATYVNHILVVIFTKRQKILAKTSEFSSDVESDVTPYLLTVHKHRCHSSMLTHW